MVVSAFYLLLVPAYLAFIALLVTAGGYLLGYSFRKGWDRAGRS